MSGPRGRREFLQLLGFGGVVFASGLAGACARPRSRSDAPADDFFFVQLSDSHWGFQGPPNPEAANTLRQAVEAVNALPRQPDFVVFTGDLTHTTDDVAERHKRMREFRAIVANLKTPVQRYMPGEHDAALDAGKAFQEHFGRAHYSFDHKGIHFAVLDNVSDPQAALGDAQLDWLHGDLKPLPAEAPIVVFTHRPLFDLAPQWDWATRDGGKAIDLLQHWKNVTVFYGHIHQEHHFTTGAIPHHAAQSLIFPLPAPGSQPKRAPLPWDPAHPRRGLGFREIAVDDTRRVLTIRQDSLEGGGAAAADKVVRVTAERFKFTPATLELKVGQAVVLELTSLDRKHGFQIPDLKIDESIAPGEVTRVRLVPDRAGTFPFHCDVFCGSGHEEMAGELVVRP